MPKLLFSCLSSDNIQAVQTLEDATFTHPWLLKQFQYEMQENPISRQIIIMQGSIVLGYLIFWITFDSSTICKIAVRPEYQRRGLAHRLIKKMEKVLRAEQVKTTTLEVRDNNYPAINFYFKEGYQFVAIKKQYYEDGTDAFYMVKEYPWKSA